MTLSCANPSTAGPTRIPPRISSTTVGTGTQRAATSERITARTATTRQTVMVPEAWRASSSDVTLGG